MKQAYQVSLTMWSRIRIAGLVLVVLLTTNHRDAHADDEVSAELVELRKIVLPVLEHNKHASFMLGPPYPIELIDELSDSRWRYRMDRAIRLLIASPEISEQSAGWSLAGKWGQPMNWEKSDIDKMLHSKEMRYVGVRSVSKSDPDWLNYCLRHILDDPQMTARDKADYWNHIERIPFEIDRYRLWLEVVQRPQWRAPCMGTFSSVSESRKAVDVMIEFLDDKHWVGVAYSMDSMGLEEIRKVAAERLRTVRKDRERVAGEIRKRLTRMTNPSDHDDLEFLLAAASTLHELSPESGDGDQYLADYYRTLGPGQAWFLQKISYESIGADRLEAAVIASIPDFKPSDRYCICEWLMNRNSPTVRNALQKLLDDPHPGTRLAAIVALSSIDPTFDATQIREKLFQEILKAPNDFMKPFESMGEALAYLALAGQSEEEALAWLEAKKDVFPLLNSHLEDAPYDISEYEWMPPGYRLMLWRDLGDEFFFESFRWSKEPDYHDRTRFPRPKPRD